MQHLGQQPRPPALECYTGKRLPCRGREHYWLKRAQYNKLPLWQRHRPWCYRPLNPGLTRSSHACESTQTLVVCVYFPSYLILSCLLQRASNAGGIAYPAVSTGCALLSFLISNAAPSCCEAPPTFVQSEEH